jgi:hypothetical protein
MNSGLPLLENYDNGLLLIPRISSTDRGSVVNGMELETPAGGFFHVMAVGDPPSGAPFDSLSVTYTPPKGDTPVAVSNGSNFSLDPGVKVERNDSGDTRPALRITIPNGAVQGKSSPADTIETDFFGGSGESPGVYVAVDAPKGGRLDGSLVRRLELPVSNQPPPNQPPSNQPPLNQPSPLKWWKYVEAFFCGLP